VVSAVPEPEPEIAAEPQSVRGPLIWVAVLASIAVLIGVGFGLGRTRRVRVFAIEVQRRLERQGGQAGVAWPIGATLNEYGALLEPKTGSDANALHEVVDLVGQARYSGRPLGFTDEARLRAMAERVWARLGQRRW